MAKQYVYHDAMDTVPCWAKAPVMNAQILLVRETCIFFMVNDPRREKMNFLTMTINTEVK